MKLKLLILFFSFLLIPIESGKIFDAQLSEYFTSEVEEESNTEFSECVFNYILIEDGGWYGDGVLVEEHFKVEQLDVPMILETGKLPKHSVFYKTPCYIRYCRLKIA